MDMCERPPVEPLGDRGALSESPPDPVCRASMTRWAISLAAETPVSIPTRTASSASSSASSSKETMSSWASCTFSYCWSTAAMSRMMAVLLGGSASAQASVSFLIVLSRSLTWVARFLRARIMVAAISKFSNSSQMRVVLTQHTLPVERLCSSSNW